MFEESYYHGPVWKDVSTFRETAMRPLSHFYDDDNSNEKSMSSTPDVMKEHSKAIPQVQADHQNTQILPVSPIVNNPLYNQGWLTTQIGKYIIIDFLIGDMYNHRQGVLLDVGISYIVIKESGTNDIVMCDIYSIRFVSVFADQNKCREYEEEYRTVPTHPSPVAKPKPASVHHGPVGNSRPKLWHGHAGYYGNKYYADINYFYYLRSRYHLYYHYQYDPYFDYYNNTY